MGEIWLVLGLLAVSTFALRAVGPVLLGGREFPARAADAVELLSPALFTALIVTQVFGSGEVWRSTSGPLGSRLPGSPLPCGRRRRWSCSPPY
jgi:branched chain amino acid efflux pump